METGEDDPLEEEKDMPVPGLTHRYPDRCLLVVTNFCSMYCRHCTRKRIWHEGESLRTRHELSNMLHYIQATPEVREVIVSGGDPLTMNIDLLDWFLGSSVLHGVINEIVRGRRGITADTALRLARYLGNSPQFWMGLQLEYDLRMAQLKSEAAIKRAVKPRAAA